MLSTKSEKYISKHWPSCDRVVVLSKLEGKTMQIAYPFSKKKRKEDFVKKALRNSKSLKFVALGFLIIGILSLLNKPNVYARIADLAWFVLLAVVMYLSGRGSRQVVHAYVELRAEMAKAPNESESSHGM